MLCQGVKASSMTLRAVGSTVRAAPFMRARGKGDARAAPNTHTMSSSEVRTARVAQGETSRTVVARTRTQHTRSDDDPPAPIVLDRYRLARRLGTGAFGTVWMARDERLQRDVAVKILARERVVGGRFEREARAAARLSHPAIVTLYEAAVDDEGAYLVSELVLGSTLDTLLTEGRLSDRDVAAIGVALCDALTHAHAQGVVHRDVKPSNVLVPEAPTSSAQVAKLTDFGVARVMGGDSLTLTGDVIGTLAYMAPEQADGQAAGEPADLYALALVIYEALSGVNPVAVVASHGVSARRLGTHLPPLRRQRRDLPRELGQVIDQALRPDPRERGTIAELRAVLLAAVPLVDDEPGVVEGPWMTLRHRATAVLPEDDRGEWEASGATGDWPPDGVDLAGDEDAGDGAVPSPRSRWLGRAGAGAAAAVCAAWLSTTVLAPTSVKPPLAALLAGAAVMALPRLGWLALLVATAVLNIAHDQVGAALVITLIGVLPVGLLLRSPTDWALPVAAPVLGFIGLAGAWPALAGRAPTVWRRAALGALGWVWLLVVAPLAGRVLYLATVSGTPPRSVWEPSADDAVRLLSDIARSGAPAGAAAWALAAAVAPCLVRGRSRALSVGAVIVWAGVTAWGTQAAIAAVHAPGGRPVAPHLLLGAAVCALVGMVALMPLPGGRHRRRWRRPRTLTSVP